MAPATVNNHLAHLSAFFTWTAVHAPAELLPHGDPDGEGGAATVAGAGAAGVG